MKPTSTFKMKKTTKRMLAAFPFPTRASQSHFHKHMIQSQLFQEQAVRVVPKGQKETDPA
jgi:hypothetical protein